TRAPEVNDRVAVGADRPQVRLRIDLILLADLRQRLDVVDVDEPLGERTIHGTEVEPADDARWPIVGDAAGPSKRVAFVGVDGDLILRPFPNRRQEVYFIGQGLDSRRRPLLGEVARAG